MRPSGVGLKKKIAALPRTVMARLVEMLMPASDSIFSLERMTAKARSRKLSKVMSAAAMGKSGKAPGTFCEKLGAMVKTAMLVMARRAALIPREVARNSGRAFGFRAPSRMRISVMPISEKREKKPAQLTAYEKL